MADMTASEMESWAEKVSAEGGCSSLKHDCDTVPFGHKCAYCDALHAIRAAYAKGAADEREACALLCDEDALCFHGSAMDDECAVAEQIAAAIRARGGEKGQNDADD